MAQSSSSSTTSASRKLRGPAHSALAAQLHQQECHTTASLSGRCLRAPSCPAPHSTAAPSGLAREQQLDALHRFVYIPFLLTLSSHSLSLDRTLASSGTDSAWLALAARLRASDALAHRSFLRASLFSASVRARAQLGTRSSVRAAAELPELSPLSHFGTTGIYASLLPKFNRSQTQPDPQPQPQPRTQRSHSATSHRRPSGWLSYKSNIVPHHLLSAYACCNDLRSTCSNELMVAPVEASLELASRNVPGPLHWRIGAVHGAPLHTPSEPPEYSNRRTLASAGVALSFSGGLFKRPSSRRRSSRTLSLMPVRSHRARVDMCTGALARSTLSLRSGPSIPSPGCFVSASAATQLGRIMRNFGDYTALSVRVDSMFGSCTPEDASVIKAAASEPSDAQSSVNCASRRRNAYSAVTASVKQQLYGPIRLGVSAQLPLEHSQLGSSGSLTSLMQQAGEQADTIVELDAPVPQAAHAVRLSLSYAPKRGEGLVELRALEM